MPIPFIKMHGLGNDFVLIDDLSPVQRIQDRRPEVTPELARAICDRRLGVGCDQLLWIRKATDLAHDARMEIFNADGSLAEMCGNGIRAVALYLYRFGPVQIRNRALISIETLSGPRATQVRLNAGSDASHAQVLVDMGPPDWRVGARDRADRSEVALNSEKISVTDALGVIHVFDYYQISMGNPHAVIFVDDVQAIDARSVGPMIECDPRFPQKTNVEFIQVLARDHIRVRVWERGAGETLACGTGACAAMVVAKVARDVCGNPATGEVKVDLPGGRLKISWLGPGESVMMEGPAVEVFRGEFEGAV